MDYEKKYKEALERAKGMMALPTDKATIEFIFPELAESEDERIRKEIINYILYKADGVSEEQEHAWIAYLEKQKENPKTADSISADCTSLAKCEDIDSKYGVFPEDVIVVARACEKLEAHGYPELAHALKNVNLCTKEQKPEELVYRLNGLMQEYINEAKNQEEEEHRFKCYKLFWEALEDSDYFEQKPAEWSEEDRNDDNLPRFYGD